MPRRFAGPGLRVRARHVPPVRRMGAFHVTCPVCAQLIAIQMAKGGVHTRLPRHHDGTSRRAHCHGSKRRIVGAKSE